jgi:peptide-methionine (R)-S-oxide reductase
MFETDTTKDKSLRGIDRRVFLGMSAAALAGLVLWRGKRPEAVEAEGVPAGPPKMVHIVEFSDAGLRQDVAVVPKIVKTDAEWRKQLTPAAFDITRKAGTEMAFTGALLNLHEKGLFRCICCDTALYSSETKFESGTGWPSFWAPIAKENVQEISDRTFGMTRTAVSCPRCDAHLGHVFDDGPRPTGLRYCMNSVAMQFVKSA